LFLVNHSAALAKFSFLAVHSNTFHNFFQTQVLPNHLFTAFKIFPHLTSAHTPNHQGARNCHATSAQPNIFFQISVLPNSLSIIFILSTHFFHSSVYLLNMLSTQIAHQAKSQKNHNVSIDHLAAHHIASQTASAINHNTFHQCVAIVLGALFSILFYL